jgi:hypothetical protein
VLEKVRRIVIATPACSALLRAVVDNLRTKVSRRDVPTPTGTPGAEREWIAARATVAIRHVRKVCGEPPAEMELELQWQDHELGAYPVIVLTWEDAMRGTPGKYLSKCEAALFEFENGEPLPQLWCWWNDED